METYEKCRETSCEAPVQVRPLYYGSGRTGYCVAHAPTLAPQDVAYVAGSVSGRYGR